MKSISVFCFLMLLMALSACGAVDNIDDLLNNGKGLKLGLWKKYLEDYGYVQGNKKSGKIHPKDLKLAIKKLQILYKFDKTTSLSRIQEFLGKPRCGVPDINNKYNSHATPEYEASKKPKNSKAKKRQRRYNTQVAWSNAKTDFTWKITVYRPEWKGLSQNEQRRIIQEAFETWKSAVPRFSFTEVASSDAADFNLAFVAGVHSSCNFPFTGPGDTIGHAYYPNDGSIHFDDDEYFTDNPSSGIYLKALAIHEIGHALGMDHSYKDTAIMYPIYTQGNPISTLDVDDINGMQALYPEYVGDNTSACGSDEDQSVCAFYKKEGYCNDLQDVMYEVCPVTCQLCN